VSSHGIGYSVLTVPRRSGYREVSEVCFPGGLPSRIRYNLINKINPAMRQRSTKCVKLRN
jgi:hypothetical protein